MSTSLKNFTALITGGSSGMGFEMAKQLLSEGANVIIAARSGQKLNDASALLSQYGNAYAVAMDVRSEESVSTAADWVENHFDRLDMLVCNAGIGNNAPGMKELPEEHRFFDIPVSTVRDVIETNFLGCFIVVSRFVPFMLRQGHGSLAYVSTSTATMTKPGQLPYGPSKAGAEAMTAIMADELREMGIMMNVICPGGFTDTPMAGEGVLEHFRKNNLPVLPPSILNKTISFLASPLSAGISGEKLIGKEFDVWLAERGIEFDFCPA